MSSFFYFLQIFVVCSVLAVSVVFGANTTAKRGVFGLGYGGDDGFNQFSSFAPNQVAALPVPFLSSSPVVYAKPVLVRKSLNGVGL